MRDNNRHITGCNISILDDIQTIFIPNDYYDLRAKIKEQAYPFWYKAQTAPEGSLTTTYLSFPASFN